MVDETQNLSVEEPTKVENITPTTATEKPLSENEQEFDHKIEGQPDFSRLTINIPADKTVKAEASVMIAMDTNVSMETKMKGGFKRLLSKENLFINEFTADKMAGELVVASGLPGDIKHYYLDGATKKTIFLQSSSFLASGVNVEVNTKWQGFVKGFFSGAGLFLIQCTGTGDVFFNSYGGIIEIEVKGEYTIDNNHIVAFTDGLDYKVKKLGSYKSFFLSKEGLVTHFQGHGTVWIQTRKVPAFASWIFPFRPSKKSSN